MKKIINKSNRFLTFPTLDFSISSGEIKEINESLYSSLKNNVFIELYNNQNTEKKVDKKIEINKKK